MKRSVAAILASLTLIAVPVSGCHGQFALFKRMQKWNGEIGSRWVNSLVHFALWVIPVYEIVLLGDLLIFNTIEFWDGGKNPVAGTLTVEKNGDELAVRIVTEEYEYVVRGRDGERARVYRDGTLIGNGQPDEEGGWVFYDLENRETRAASAAELTRAFAQAPTSP